ncbi:hypothetical protein [Dethiothermospora halolimnae]|uniref:hypothetical protein n=1 Tax=Dethiothermospora halolimnae TaxID=3114390 RepID=UPI003CCBB086
MRSRIFKIIHKDDGAALITVLIAFMVIMIFLGGTIMLFSNNLVQSKTQERGVEAYYLAISGIDLGVAALLQEGPGGENDTLLYKKYSEYMKPNINDTPTLDDTISCDNGKIHITIKAKNIDGKRWIEVHSIGTLKDTSISRSTNLQFLASNPKVQKREKNRP